MNDETAAQLVKHLTHPNGWWRDTAQQLIVLKRDLSIVPALEAIAKTSDSLVGRFHALWALEGLGALDARLARQLMEDREPRLRIQAIRASETLYKSGDRSFAADYHAMAKDASVDVAIQAMLTLNRWKVPDGAATLRATMERRKERGVQVVATTFLNAAANAGRGRGGIPLAQEQQALLARGGEVYNSLCITCHGPDGTGVPAVDGKTTMAPSLAGSPRVNGHRDYVIRTVLDGLTGPLDGRTYPQVMIPMRTNDDEWVAAVASYVRQSFGNSGGFVKPSHVAGVRTSRGPRTTPWEVDELKAALPVPLVKDAWTVSASHNADIARRALSLQSWNSGIPQASGMWFQIELPKAATLIEMQFESTSGAYRILEGRVRNADAPPAPARGAGRGAAAREQAGPPLPPPPHGYPRGYKVDVSADGTTWKVVAEGKDTWHDVVMLSSGGTGVQESVATTTIPFAPVLARFIRITQTENVDNAPVWSVQSLRLFEAAKAPGQ
jgi:mono/diheme cytochrome c family protein